MCERGRVFVFEREGEFVWKREREREVVCVRDREGLSEREKERVYERGEEFVWCGRKIGEEFVYLCVFEREREEECLRVCVPERVCVCVCVSEIYRERNKRLGIIFKMPFKDKKLYLRKLYTFQV